MDEDKSKHRMTAIEASQGEKLNMMRWVLGIGMVLVIIALIVAFLIGAY